jgi:hypothetical protein
MGFDITGKILLPETKIADKKYEGFEFIWNAANKFLNIKKLILYINISYFKIQRREKILWLRWRQLMMVFSFIGRFI